MRAWLSSRVRRTAGVFFAFFVETFRDSRATFTHPGTLSAADGAEHSVRVSFSPHGTDLGKQRYYMVSGFSCILAGSILNLLVALDALLREKNVTRAAERMFVSQPAMSVALAKLRHHFG